MKTEIKNKVQKAIEAHQATNKEYITKIGNWKKDTTYAQEYKEIQIAELEKKIQENNKKYKEILRNIITEEKEVVIGESRTKPTDYQAQIANAFKFIEAAGKDLNDERASEILKPFQGDYETMRLFQDAINKQAAGLFNQFEKTFEKTNHMTQIKDSFTTAEGTYDGLFDNTLTGAVKTGYFMENINSINKLAEQI